MRGCALVVVPQEVGTLPALRKLQLDRNPGLRQRRPGAAATALAELSMRRCFLEYVPHELASMPALRTLRLRGNYLIADANVQALQQLSAAVSLDIDVPDRGVGA